MKNVVDFLEIAERLECEYRLTRMSDGRPQSVASHSWNMAMMAIALKPYLKTPVNMERVLEYCILHDLPESIAHDTPRHEQTDARRAEKHAAESDAICQICELLNNSEISARFDEYERRASPESRLVKALDLLDAALQHLCSQDLRYIGEYADNFYWKLFFSDELADAIKFEPALTAIFDEIKSRVAVRLKNELGVDASVFCGAIK